MGELCRVEGISKRFGSRRVLNDVGFSVLSGEVLGLIGPNGAGKTTLLECVAGLMPSDGGTVHFDGAKVSPLHRKERMFYLPDAIFPWAQQTVSWALRFFQRLYPESKSTVTNLSGPLRLTELFQSRLGSLSKGERKRVLLALGLLTSHELLLLDEPFDGLDLRQTRDVMKLLKAEAANGRTLLLSIHQLIDAGRVCDRLVLLSAGNSVGEGTLSELQTLAGVPDGGVEEIFLALT